MRAAGSIDTLTGTIQVRAEASSDAHELTLAVEVAPAKPVRLLISHHVALNGDDGSTAGRASWRTEGDAVVVTPAARRPKWRAAFPNGSFAIDAARQHRVSARRRRRAAVRGRPVPGTAIYMYRHRPRPGGRIADSRATGDRERPAAAARRQSRRALAPQIEDECAGGRAAQPARGAHRRHRALVRAQRVRALPVAARPGAVLGRRLGHARCVPGSGRVAARARARRADPRSAAAGDERAECRRRLAAVVHVLRARSRRPRRRLARRHRVLAGARARAVPDRLGRRGSCSTSKLQARRCGSTPSERSR